MSCKRIFIVLLGFASWACQSDAQDLRRDWQALRDAPHRTDAAELPAGTRVLRDVAYGPHARMRLDAYLPAGVRHAPVILLVHGGGWAHGDKDHPGLIADKARYWLPKGYALISANYRLLPDAGPLQQAQDVARALAHAQAMAREWNLDASRFVLMGHSAGAHLVALLAASPSLLTAAHARAPRGAVSLDSAAMDVPQMMALPRHPPLYDRAFGSDRQDWIAASPYHQLSRDSLPMLAVCSTRRPDACPQGRALAHKAADMGVGIEVLPEDLSHMQINRALGQVSDYTLAVDRFIRRLAE